MYTYRIMRMCFPQSRIMSGRADNTKCIIASSDRRPLSGCFTRLSRMSWPVVQTMATFADPGTSMFGSVMYCRAVRVRLLRCLCVFVHCTNSALSVKYMPHWSVFWPRIFPTLQIVSKHEKMPTLNILSNARQGGTFDYDLGQLLFASNS